MESEESLDEPLTEPALRQRVAELARVQRIGRIGGFEIDLRGGHFRNRRSPEYLSVHELSANDTLEPHEAWVHRIHPDDRERAESYFKTCVLGTGRHYSSEYRIVLPGQGVRWISAVAEIDRDETGAPLRMVGVHIDITRTKQAEEALRASELALKQSEQRLLELNAALEKLAHERARQLANSRAQLQAFFHNSPDWLTLQRHTPEGTFVFVDINPVCERAYGLPRSQVIGRRVEEILGEEGAQIPLAHFRECIRTGKTQRYVTHRTMAGVTRFIDVMVSPIPGAQDGGDRFVLTTARDLTDREKLESQLRQSQKMEAIGQLTGGVAHDFNNLLTVILGCATLLKTGAARDPQKSLDNILLAGERGTTLIRQLLSLARNSPTELEVIELSEHVPKMAGMLRSSLRGDISLQICIAPDVRPVQTDVGELEIALLNIAVNARDAMPSGGRFTITVENVAPGNHPPELPLSSPGYVALSARDSGVGMPPEVAARVFEPFFTTKTLGTGTGLGLSQVSGFARSSGGAVQVASRPGEGTCITIFLPAACAGQTDVPLVQGQRPMRPLAGRILLVDDNTEVMRTMQGLIASMGLETETASSASQALDLLRASSGRFNVLLTDVVMPDMSGVALAYMARRLDARLPIILMSGYNDAAPPSEFQILRKPIPYDVLYSVLEGLVEPA